MRYLFLIFLLNVPDLSSPHQVQQPIEGVQSHFESLGTLTWTSGYLLVSQYSTGDCTGYSQMILKPINFCVYNPDDSIYHKYISMTDLGDGYYRLFETLYSDSSCTQIVSSQEAFQFATCLQDTVIPNMKSIQFSHVDDVPLYVYDGLAIRSSAAGSLCDSTDGNFDVLAYTPFNKCLSYALDGNVAYQMYTSCSYGALQFDLAYGYSEVAYGVQYYVSLFSDSACTIPNFGGYLNGFENQYDYCNASWVGGTSGAGDSSGFFISGECALGIHTAEPTGQPSQQPSRHPTSRPTIRTNKPSPKPTSQPSSRTPTRVPTALPSVNPSANPTFIPSPFPTSDPTPEPSGLPSVVPSPVPSFVPSPEPSSPPSVVPSSDPTPGPSQIPTPLPSMIPSAEPTSNPTVAPTLNPSANPSEEPTTQPTAEPTVEPTPIPSDLPSATPSANPTTTITAIPTTRPTPNPTSVPTLIPTEYPSPEPSPKPSSEPSYIPTQSPTAKPSKRPTSIPSLHPTEEPSSFPSEQPTADPTLASPTIRPSKPPSKIPSQRPSREPTTRPTLSHTLAPTPVSTIFQTQEPTEFATVTAAPSLMNSHESASPTSPTTTAAPSPAESQESASPSASPSSVQSQESASPTFSTTTAAPSPADSQESVSPTGTPSSVQSQESASPTSPATEMQTATPTPSDALVTTSPSATASVPPSFSPTVTSSRSPFKRPSKRPSLWPSGAPTALPSAVPTALPSAILKGLPSVEPTALPSGIPTALPSIGPTVRPSAIPKALPSVGPTEKPSAVPTDLPSIVPTELPVTLPSDSPSSSPSLYPTYIPTPVPTTVPSRTPTALHSFAPSVIPSAVPSRTPTAIPIKTPSATPTSKNSKHSSIPTVPPTILSSPVPSMAPTPSPLQVVTVITSFSLGNNLSLAKVQADTNSQNAIKDALAAVVSGVASTTLTLRDAIPISRRLILSANESASHDLFVMANLTVSLVLLGYSPRLLQSPAVLLAALNTAAETSMESLQASFADGSFARSLAGFLIANNATAITPSYISRINATLASSLSVSSTLPLQFSPSPAPSYQPRQRTYLTSSQPTGRPSYVKIQIRQQAFVTPTDTGMTTTKKVIISTSTVTAFLMFAMGFVAYQSMRKAKQLEEELAKKLEPVLEEAARDAMHELGELGAAIEEVVDHEIEEMEAGITHLLVGAGHEEQAAQSVAIQMHEEGEVETNAPRLAAARGSDAAHQGVVQTIDAPAAAGPSLSRNVSINSLLQRSSFNKVAPVSVDAAGNEFVAVPEPSLRRPSKCQGKVMPEPGPECDAESKQLSDTALVASETVGQLLFNAANRLTTMSSGKVGQAPPPFASKPDKKTSSEGSFVLISERLPTSIIVIANDAEDGDVGDGVSTALKNAWGAPSSSRSSTAATGDRRYSDDVRPSSASDSKSSTPAGDDEVEPISSVPEKPVSISIPSTAGLLEKTIVVTADGETKDISESGFSPQHGISLASPEPSRSVRAVSSVAPVPVPAPVPAAASGGWNYRDFVRMRADQLRKFNPTASPAVVNPRAMTAPALATIGETRNSVSVPVDNEFATQDSKSDMERLTDLFPFAEPLPTTQSSTSSSKMILTAPSLDISEVLSRTQTPTMSSNAKAFSNWNASDFGKLKRVASPAIGNQSNAMRAMAQTLATPSLIANESNDLGAFNTNSSPTYLSQTTPISPTVMGADGVSQSEDASSMQRSDAFLLPGGRSPIGPFTLKPAQAKQLGSWNAKDFARMKRGSPMVAASLAPSSPHQQPDPSAVDNDYVRSFDSPNASFSSLAADQMLSTRASSLAARRTSPSANNAESKMEDTSDEQSLERPQTVAASYRDFVKTRAPQKRSFSVGADPLEVEKAAERAIAAAAAAAAAASPSRSVRFAINEMASPGLDDLTGDFEDDQKRDAEGDFLDAALDLLDRSHRDNSTLVAFSTPEEKKKAAEEIRVCDPIVPFEPLATSLS